jgi:hypothetical protein
MGTPTQPYSPSRHPPRSATGASFLAQRRLQVVVGLQVQPEPIHPEPKDCRLLAECEAMEMDVLVSVDRDLVKQLTPMARTSLLSPGDCWTRLGIAPNTPPVREPHPKHPLAGTTYWRV